MEKNYPSLEEPSSKIINDDDNTLACVGGILSKKDECSLAVASKTLPSSKKRRNVDEDLAIAPDCITQNQSDVSSVSPSVIRTRYGRIHKPKIPEDFRPTDKMFAAILGHSPNKSPGKTAGSPVSATPVELSKVCQKEWRPYDIFVNKDRRSKGNTKLGRSNRDTNTENLGVSNAKSEKLYMENYGVDPKKPEATSVAENAREGESVVTDKTWRSSEISVCDEKVPGCDWVIGDIAWGHVSGYPFWPCMTTLDPQQRIFTKTTGECSIAIQIECVHDRCIGTIPVASSIMYVLQKQQYRSLLTITGPNTHCYILHTLSVTEFGLNFRLLAIM
jgi:hypothetical protein